MEVRSGQRVTWYGIHSLAIGALFVYHFGPANLEGTRMVSATGIAHMSPTDRIGEAMRRSLPHLPAEARGFVEAMLKPETLAIIGGTLVVWAGSHFFGIGEIVDTILLGVGVLTIGFAVFEGADALYESATGAIDAKSESDLDRAARTFARAVTILGVSAIQALLMRGPARTAISRGRPQVQPRIYVGTPPQPGNQLRMSRTSRPLGGAGETNAYGVITISRNQSLTEQRITLFHELVHRYFAPRTGPLRQIRAELSMSGYSRSALLRYLEEALAEGYGRLRVHGLARALKSYRFPVQAGYMTVSELAAEGVLIGTIALGGVLFRVSISLGPMKNQ
jgi:hypothetical protein